MPPHGARPVRPPRPALVTAAVWVQIGTVAVLLVLVGLVLRYAVDAQADVDQAVLAVPDADPAEISWARTGSTVGSALLAAPLLVQAAWLAATAPSVRRGGNAARILVFVAGGLQLLLCLGPCCAGTLLSPLLAALAPIDTEPRENAAPSESEFLQHLNAGNADPFGDLVEGLLFLGMPVVLLLTAVVVLLLALPPAQRYFVPRPGAHPPRAVVVMPGQLWPPAGPPGASSRYGG